MMRLIWIAAVVLFLSPQQEMQDRPMGDPPALVADPAARPDRSTPEALLRGLLDARHREDLAFLARCHHSTAGKRALDQLDLAFAWREYAQRSVAPLWTKIEAALDSGDFTTDGATMTFEVGGALQRLTLSFESIAGAWYLR